MKISVSPELQGSYKLSKTILDKINLNSNSLCEDNVDTISNNEILAILHFSHICDTSGCIEQFKISELPEIIGCTRRASYNIINNLVRKGFITISDTCWTGCRKITLLNNDFSDGTFSERYLNTNFTFFSYLHEDYTKFKGLSLYAKKTLLIILFNYQEKYGYRVSIKTLMDYIDIKTKGKIIGYVDELKGMFNANHFSINGSKQYRVKHENILVTPKAAIFSANTGIEEYQTCYIKHDILTELNNRGIRFKTFYNIDKISKTELIRKQLQSMYLLTVSCVSKGISYLDIKKIIIKHAMSNNSIDELSLNRIRAELFIPETPKIGCG